MFTGAGRLDCGIQGQQVGLTGDLFDDGDLGGNFLHGGNRLDNRLATIFGVNGALDGNLFRLHRVIGILADTGGHLFHAGGNLFGRGGLLGGALGHLLSGGRKLLAAGGDVVGSAYDFTDHLLQLLDHLAEGGHHDAGFIL